ncbi:MAG: Ca2+-dependent phosphoinositide-specific phospholipase C [Hymenobacter sp.]
MNAKDEPLSRPGFTVPEPFTAATFDALDKEIRDNLGADQLLTPDQVRGSYPTLEAAVLHRHWPTLQAAQGKFVFILDEVGAKRAAYIQGHPSLKGRVLFADAEPGTPEAAIHILNNAKKDQAIIKSLVEKGYIIRTRADSDTQEARRNDKSSLAAAEQSGAQIISTDYYLPSTHFKSDYAVSFPDGKYFRLNPIL